MGSGRSGYVVSHIHVNILRITGGGQDILALQVVHIEKWLVW